MQIKPTLDHLVVKQCEAAKMAGSIVLPDQAQKQGHIGKVLSCAPRDGSRFTTISSPREVEPPFKTNDTVVFQKYAGQEFEFKGEKFLILNHSDVLAKIEE